jgi:signal peptidase II
LTSPALVMRGRPRWAAFGLIVAVVVGLDQLTKSWIAATLAPGESMAVIGDIVRLVHSQNSGALFGLLPDSAPAFAAISIAVVGAIVWYQSRAGVSRYITVTLGLLLGGALGNLADRIRLGYVIDFVDAGLGSLRWWTFNVADASISLAIVLLFLASVRPSLAATGPAASDA